MDLITTSPKDYEMQADIWRDDFRQWQEEQIEKAEKIFSAIHLYHGAVDGVSVNGRYTSTDYQDMLEIIKNSHSSTWHITTPANESVELTVENLVVKKSDNSWLQSIINGATI